MAPLLDEEKKKAQEAIVTALVDAVEKGELNDEEMAKSARYIQYSMDNIVSHEELILFLRDVMDHWPAYKGVFVQFKGEHAQKEDSAKMAEIQSKLQSMITPK